MPTFVEYVADEVLAFLKRSGSLMEAPITRTRRGDGVELAISMNINFRELLKAVGNLTDPRSVGFDIKYDALHKCVYLTIKPGDPDSEIIVPLWGDVKDVAGSLLPEDCPYRAQLSDGDLYNVAAATVLAGCTPDDVGRCTVHVNHDRMELDTAVRRTITSTKLLGFIGSCSDELRSVCLTFDGHLQVVLGYVDEPPQYSARRPLSYGKRAYDPGASPPAKRRRIVETPSIRIEETA